MLPMPLVAPDCMLGCVFAIVSNAPCLMNRAYIYIAKVRGRCFSANSETFVTFIVRVFMLGCVYITCLEYKSASGALWEQV